MYIRFFFLLLLSGLASLLQAATTDQVFNSFKDRLVQVRIVDNSTNSKSTIGSGFYINKNGTIITNYHVVARHVFKPDQYRIEYVTSDNKIHKAELSNIDVIHDLAMLDGDSTDAPFLPVKLQQLAQGSRIYTLGNPLDLGMTIVEGTYNGTTDDTMHERILLSGALNPGMSGGPSILDDGTVVGVNVATAGNSIGFLVPEKYLRNFIQQSQSASGDDFLKIMRDQILANQQQYLSALLEKPFPVKQLADYTVPDRLAEYINCWGDSKYDGVPYRSSDNYCATKNDIYVNQRLSTGDIRYTHHLLQSDSMNSIRFYNLLTSYFKNPGTSLSGHKEDFTEFNCKTDFVVHGEVNFKLAFCLRRYKKFEDLYDMVLTAGTLTEKTNGLISTLVLAGVSYDNAVRFSKTYLEAFAWKRP